MSPWARSIAALPVLLLGVLVRLVREGMVLRALAWPALLLSLALLGSAATVAAMSPPGRAVFVAVPSGDPVLAPLQEAGLAVVEVADPEEARVHIRAAWSGPEGPVLTVQRGGWASLFSRQATEDLTVEAALRDHVGAAWRVEVTENRGRPPGLELHSSRMAGLIAALYVLYGVVFGAGIIERDRGSGALEAELSLPVFAWVPGAARVLGAGLVLGGGGVLSIAWVHVLLGIDGPHHWALQAAGAAVGAVVLGIGGAARGGPLAGAGGGFSHALSRGLALAAGLVGVGFVFPAVGAWLPVAAVGALAAGTVPGALPLVLVAPMAAAAAWFVAGGQR